MAQISGEEIQKMVRHWLEVPENGYLGSSYGSNIRALLQRPQFGDRRRVDAFLAKLRRDVPVLAALPADAIALYAQPKGADEMHLVLSVSGRNYDLSELT